MDEFPVKGSFQQTMVLMDESLAGDVRFSKGIDVLPSHSLIHDKDQDPLLPVKHMWIILSLVASEGSERRYHEGKERDSFVRC